jgi:hypothetical protein
MSCIEARALRILRCQGEVQEEEEDGDPVALFHANRLLPLPL